VIKVIEMTDDELVELCDVGLAKLLQSCAPKANMSSTEMMKLVKEDRMLRLKVYHRRVPGSSASQFKAVIEMPYSISTVMGAVFDTNVRMNWDRNMAKLDNSLTIREVSMPQRTDEEQSAPQKITGLTPSPSTLPPSHPMEPGRGTHVAHPGNSRSSSSFTAARGGGGPIARYYVGLCATKKVGPVSGRISWTAHSWVLSRTCPRESSWSTQQEEEEIKVAEMSKQAPPTAPPPPPPLLQQAEKRLKKRWQQRRLCSPKISHLVPGSRAATD